MTRYASSAPGPGLETWSRIWEVQRAPYRSPLPFQFSLRKETQYPFAVPSNYPVNDYLSGFVQLNGDDFGILSEVTNLARAKAVDAMKAGRGAALGLTLIDWKKSLQLIAGACKSLANKADRKKLYYKRRSSELYLEGVFGWLPLMQDIYDAVHTLSGAHSSSPTRKKATSSDSFAIDIDTVKGNVLADYGVLVGGLGRMNNPNLALISDLGLINPAAVAWDLVPYSFVVNWFLPVGSFLNGLTDLVGYDVEDGFTTSYIKKTASGNILVYDPGIDDFVWRSRSITGVYTFRSLGFPSVAFPSFRLPSPDLFKSLVSFSLLDINLRKAARKLPKRNRRGDFDYTE